MNPADLTIRPMKVNDISDAMSLSNAEGWNQTEKDWKFLIENSGNICLLAENNKTVIGTVTAMNYSNAVVWIGMVLVHKDYRGIGISKSLLTTLFKNKDSFKTVKLDATPAGQAVYEKFGFKEEYFIARMVNPLIKNLTGNEYDIKPQSIQEKDIPEIIALDKIVFGANRGSLIEFMINQYPGNGWFLKRNNLISGFILGRQGNKYHHIGPLVSTVSTDAEILLATALKNGINKAVAIDILFDKQNLISWLTTIGFSKQRHFVRMYKNENHYPGVIKNQYLICGPEFG